MKNKKATIGWGYVVALVIGLIVIGLIIYISLKSKGKISDLIENFASLF